MLGKVTWTLALSAFLMIGCSDDTSTPPVEDSGPDSPMVDMSQTDSTSTGDSTVDTGGSTGDSTVDTTAALNCTDCHGFPPNNGRHGLHISKSNINCSTCHNTTVDANDNIISGGTHQNNSDDVSSTQFDFSNGRCTNVDCHGNENW